MIIIRVLTFSLCTAKSKNGYRVKRSSSTERWENSDYNKSTQLVMGEEEREKEPEEEEREEKERKEEECEEAEVKAVVDEICTEPESNTDVIAP